MLRALRIPEGWTLEPLAGDTHVLIRSPTPMCFMATIDFKLRGFRDGCSTTGLLVGEMWNKKRKKYDGRGWQQLLVDDAVAHFQGILR